MAYLDPPARFRISRSIRRLLGDEAGPSAASWQQRVFARNGEFLFDHGLDPTPDNYDLAFQFHAATNEALVVAIRAEIERVGGLDRDAADRLFAAHAGPVTADALSLLTEAVATHAVGMSAIVQQSRHDVREFRTALEAQGDAPEVATVLELTRAMVSRSRAAEAQMRATQRELAGLRTSLAEAQRVADVDPLTDLPNRRAFKRSLEAAVDAARAESRPLSLAFIDLDHFKRVNDTHGHETGDRVLRYVAALLTQHFNGDAVVGRFGGEEFVVMLPQLTLRDARDAVDACREALTSRHLYAATDGASIGTISFSAGVTALADGDGTAELLRRADEALYRGKAAGRNRVIIA